MRSKFDHIFSKLNSGSSYEQDLETVGELRRAISRHHIRRNVTWGLFWGAMISLQALCVQMGTSPYLAAACAAWIALLWIWDLQRDLKTQRGTMKQLKELESTIRGILFIKNLKRKEGLPPCQCSKCQSAREELAGEQQG